MVRSVLPGPFNVLIAKYTTKDLEEVSGAAARGELVLPVARIVPLTQAIEALAELESNHTPKGGKLLITTQRLAADPLRAGVRRKDEPRPGASTK